MEEGGALPLSMTEQDRHGTGFTHQFVQVQLNLKKHAAENTNLWYHYSESLRFDSQTKTFRVIQRVPFFEVNQL